MMLPEHAAALIAARGRAERCRRIERRLGLNRLAGSPSTRAPRAPLPHLEFESESRRWGLFRSPVQLPRCGNLAL